MNYYPFLGGFPSITMPSATTTSLFGRLFRNFNLGSIISNTQKTLGFINQALPVVKQISPVVKNAKTMFKVMNEFRKVDTPITNDEIIANAETIKTNEANNEVVFSNGPTFFL